MRPARGGRAWGARPDGVRAVEGRLLVSLPAEMPIAEFREELQAALRHLRLHEVTSEMAYMEARSDACLEYVVDPAEAPWRLFWVVVAARLAAIEGAP